MGCSALLKWGSWSSSSYVHRRCLLFHLHLRVSAFPLVYSSVRCLSQVSTQGEETYYQTLNVNERATQADIKRAYYELSKVYHPDRQQGDLEAAQKFRDVAEAYEVLGNLKLRRLYDRGLLHTAEGYRHHRGASHSHRSHEEAGRRGGATVSTGPRRQPGTAIRTGGSTEKPVQAMSGKTNIYDFDAWQNAHYSQMVSKRRSASRRYDEMKGEQAGGQEFKNEIDVIVVIFVFIVLFFFAGLTSSNDFDRETSRKRLVAIEKAKKAEEREKAANKGEPGKES